MNPLNNQNKSRGLIVLGMHRTGTSVLAGCLHRLGYHAGDDLLKAGDDNPTGFFESQQLVDMHESFLVSQGTDHLTTDLLPGGWDQSPEARQLQDSIIKFLDGLDQSGKNWLIKDPRIISLWPLWSRALEGRSVKLVLTLRHPSEVAWSLARRNGLQLERALELYYQGLRSVWTGLAGFPHAVVCYSYLVQEPIEALRLLNERLALGLEDRLHRQAEEIQNFVQPDLKHWDHESDPFFHFHPAYQEAEKLYKEMLSTALIPNDWQPAPPKKVDRKILICLPADESRRNALLSILSRWMENKRDALIFFSSSPIDLSKDLKIYHPLEETEFARFRAEERNTHFGLMVCEYEADLEIIQLLQRLACWKIPVVGIPLSPVLSGDAPLYHYLDAIMPAEKAAFPEKVAEHLDEMVLRPGPSPLTMREKSCGTNNPDNLKTVLVVAHSASRTGAPLLLNRLLHHLVFVERKKVVIILRQWEGPEGHLEVDMARLGPLYRWNEAGRMAFEHDRLAWPLSLVLSNTVTNGEVLYELRGLKLPVVTWAQELPYVIQNWLTPESRQQAGVLSDYFIAPSAQVHEGLVETLGVSPENIEIIANFPNLKTLTAEEKHESKETLRQRLGLPVDAFVVITAGSRDWRKGVDWFLQAARLLANRANAGDLCLVWAGGGENWLGSAQWNYDLERYGVPGLVRYVGLQDNLHPWLRASDAYALFSREDPFPLVLLEAAASALPSLVFEKSGGGPEFVSMGGGCAVPYGDLAAFTRQLLAWKDQPGERSRLGLRARETQKEYHDPERQCGRLTTFLDDRAVAWKRLAEKDRAYQKSVPAPPPPPVSPLLKLEADLSEAQAEISRLVKHAREIHDTKENDLLKLESYLTETLRVKDADLVSMKELLEKQNGELELLQTELQSSQNRAEALASILRTPGGRLLRFILRTNKD
jgi:glycosyltransferase involved in cell wall biosynthesis